MGVSSGNDYVGGSVLLNVYIQIYINKIYVLYIYKHMYIYIIHLFNIRGRNVAQALEHSVVKVWIL